MHQHTGWPQEEVSTSVCTDVAYQLCADSSLISHLWGAAEDWEGITWNLSGSSFSNTNIRNVYMRAENGCQVQRDKQTKLSLPWPLMNRLIRVKLKRWLVFVCETLSLFLRGMRLLLLSKCTALGQTLQTRTIFVTQRCYVKDGVWFQRNIMRWRNWRNMLSWTERKGGSVATC